MSEILDAIRSRRATKTFVRGHEISEADLGTILNAARHAPTAFNIQNWRFLVVRDEAVRDEISAVAWNQPQIKDCSALIVMCADIDAWKEDTRRYWKDAPEEMQQKYTGMIRGFYEGREQMQRDEGFRSAGMAAYAIMMAASALGYQTCPMDGFDFGKVAEVVRLPKHYEIAMFVAVGKGTGELPPHGGQIPDGDVIAYDRFA